VRAILEKRIPVGGGLGGGSSDAATTLTALNELLELRVSAEDLLALAASLGSDVPFFLGPPAAIGRGRGEILTAVPHETCFWAALAFPRISVSTAQVYARYDPSDEAPAEDHLPTLVEALRLKNLSRTLALLTNAMEPLAFALEPRLGILRDELEAVAGQPVRMSGSGSTLFTLASSETKATRIAERWQATGSLRVATAPFLR
jgi:4-diphosphocytidyl-2C-methyl-D-erythritol kinase